MLMLWLELELFGGAAGASGGKALRTSKSNCLSCSMGIYQFDEGQRQRSMAFSRIIRHGYSIFKQRSQWIKDLKAVD